MLVQIQEFHRGCKVFERAKSGQWYQIREAGQAELRQNVTTV